MLTEEEPMMLPDTAGENFHQLSPRTAETLMAKRGELFGIRLACDHGLQHAPPAGAHDVCDHRTQLDVRLLQRWPIAARPVEAANQGLQHWRPRPRPRRFRLSLLPASIRSMLVAAIT